MHFKILSAICFDLGQSKILSSGHGLRVYETLKCKSSHKLVLKSILTDKQLNHEVERYLDICRRIIKSKHFLRIPACSDCVD